MQDTDAGSKPFFFWLGTSDPHRSYKLNSGRESGIDISKVHMFDHYPDSDVIRSDIADYYFEVQRWDTLVGSAMAELEKRDLLENTIIIMTGDHGMPFPRCKGNMYDSGVHVPFAVRWGKVIKPGRRVEDFLSFVDIAPTLLEASDTKIPDNMSGRSFLDVLQSAESGLVDTENRSSIVFGRERHTVAQEQPSVVGYPSRGLRNSDFLYVKNFEPDRWPAGADDVYRDCDGGPTKSYIIENRNKDAEHKRAYELCFAKRPEEELYDVRKDPCQLNNLAANPEYHSTLKNMRGQMQKRLGELNDPRASAPHYDGFDSYPYLGGGGRKKPKGK
jgi:arylsulfatase A-like enzyme